MVAAKDLQLPAGAKVICHYRDGKFSHADEETKFRTGDEIVILTHSKNMPALQERWQPKPAQEEAIDRDNFAATSRERKP
jgi:trk system potassium uptake protein TrkA